MTAAGGSLDRATTTLGAVAVASAVFVFARGDINFIRVRGGSLVVVLALGLLAIVAGRLASRTLTFVAVAGFLAIAAVLLALMTQGCGGVLEGAGSIFSFCPVLAVFVPRRRLSLYPQISHPPPPPRCPRLVGRASARLWRLPPRVLFSSVGERL